MGNAPIFYFALPCFEGQEWRLSGLLRAVFCSTTVT